MSMKMTAEKLSRQNDIAIGNLELAQSNVDAKKILTNYRHELTHLTNTKYLKTFTNLELENTAAFVKLKVRDPSTGDQLYQNKDVLVDRLILKIESYLENVCGECDSKYRNELNDPSEPLLTCYTCIQWSHNCTKMQERYDKYNDILLYGPEIILPPFGLVWLCNWCHVNLEANFPPWKPKKVPKISDTEKPNDSKLNAISEKGQEGPAEKKEGKKRKS